MKKMQSFAQEFQSKMGWEIKTLNYDASRASLLNNYMLLTTEVAEVAEELRKLFNLTHKYIGQGMEESKAFELAKDEFRNNIGAELADCIAYICKFANFFGCDLEDEFYKKMEIVQYRQNKDISI
jgi:NTP pyrophosphatase (non-canonical NTP hydrolase)